MALIPHFCNYIGAVFIHFFQKLHVRVESLNRYSFNRILFELVVPPQMNLVFEREVLKGITNRHRKLFTESEYHEIEVYSHRNHFIYFFISVHFL
jgi:hypothetical protein